MLMKLALFLISLSEALLALPRASLDQKIIEAATANQLDPKLVTAIIQVESAFQVGATSPKGAMGLMQVMPKTAAQCGVTVPYHALNNLMGACRCLKRLIAHNHRSLPIALAAYNAGQGAVNRYKGIPPYTETKNYVKEVLRIYKKLRSPKNS